MSSNLANIYATLRRKYGANYTINYWLPPSYLTQIVGENEIGTQTKIVFIYKEDLSKKHSLNMVSPAKIKIENRAVDLNLTGSPLKDDCHIESIGNMSLDLNVENLNPWKQEEESHKGIKIEKARIMISDEEVQLSSNVDSKGSVWILCDGEDGDQTLFLQYEVNKGYFSRGLISFLGISPTYMLNTQSILQKHYKYAKMGADIETFIENTYQVKSNMLLKCSWSSNSKTPSLTGLINCDVLLNQKLRINDCDISIEDFLIQLRLLWHIRDAIVLFYKSKRSSEPCTDPKYSFGSEMDMAELKKNINEIMTEISGFDDIDSSVLDCDMEEVITKCKIRPLVDLTDKLWEILKCCPSYKDLKMAFNIVFQCAARCNLVNTPNNKNRLAELITELSNRRIAIPCLSGSEPLELLLEIGLEKLYKDYEFILSKSQVCSSKTLQMLCTSNDDNQDNEKNLPVVRKSLRNAAGQTDKSGGRKSLLHSNMKTSTEYQSDENLEFKNSYFNDKDSATRLARLLQIHCALGHLLMIHINMNLPKVYPDIFEQLLRRPLRYVDYIHDSHTDEMEFLLSYQKIQEHINGRDPHQRRITVTTKNKGQCVKSTFFYSMDNICPPGISESFPSEDKEFVKENVYYGWLYRKIIRYRN